MAETKIVRLTAPNGVTVGVSEEKAERLLGVGYTKKSARPAAAKKADTAVTPQKPGDQSGTPNPDAPK